MTREPRAGRGRVADALVLAAAGVFFSALVVGIALQKSATFDEPANLATGYLALTTSDYHLLPQNLPLVRLLAAIPLALVGVRAAPVPLPANEMTPWVFADRLLYRQNDADQLLLLARLALLPLALLAGAAVYLWAKDLHGRGGATFALALFCLEPSVIAHSGLVTTDVPVAAFVFLSLFAAYRLTTGIRLGRLVVAGVGLGLALLTKFTALLFLPLLLVLGIAAVLRDRPVPVALPGWRADLASRSSRALALLFTSAFAGAVAFGLVWAGYQFSGDSNAVAGLAYPQPWTTIAPPGSLGSAAIRWLREAGWLPDAYLYGFASHRFKSGDFAAYLLGEIRTAGWWYYFAVTYLVKTPIALLILFALAASVALRQRADRIAMAFLFLPVAGYFLGVSLLGWNIGHRHLLPIYPFLFVAAGGLVPWAARRGRFAKGVLGSLLAWYAWSSLSIWPHSLAYFNELAGGPEHGPEVLLDSNLDWGQDLAALARYLDERGTDRVWLSYFGSASPTYYGIAYDYLPSLFILDQRSRREDLLRLRQLPLLEGTVAISATNLYGVYLEAAAGVHRDYFARYRELEPTARIGHSIYVYEIDGARPE